MSAATPIDADERLHELQMLVRTGRLADWWHRPMAAALRSTAGIAELGADEWAAIGWYGVLELWRHDPGVSDILVNGPDRDIFVVQHGMQVPTGVRPHRSWIEFAQRQIALRSGMTTAAAPDDWHDAQGAPVHTLEATAERTLRAALTREPCSPDGPTIAIRVLPRAWRRLEDLVKGEVITRPAAELLVEALRCGVTVLVGGATGAGKTTLLAALLQELGETRRVIVIEQCQELPALRNSVGLEVNQSGRSFSDLVRLALRQKPDLVVVGEVRGPESLAMLQAAATGHPGIASIHANDTQAALKNLERMACEQEGVAPTIVRGMLTSSAVPLLVCHIGSYGGRRAVGAIDEVEIAGGTAAVGAHYTTNPLFVWDAARRALVQRFHVKGAWGLGRL